MFLKNKKSWMKIIEAFTAVLLLSGILMLIVSNYNEKENNAEKIYSEEYHILRNIQLKNNLRDEIANEEVIVPIEMENFGKDSLLSGVYNEITTKIPSYLECDAKICDSSNSCEPSVKVPLNKNVYSQSVLISATLTQTVYRQLKLFCWMK